VPVDRRRPGKGIRTPRRRLSCSLSLPPLSSRIPLPFPCERPANPSPYPRRAPPFRAAPCSTDKPRSFASSSEVSSSKESAAGGRRRRRRPLLLCRTRAPPPPNSLPSGVPRPRRRVHPTQGEPPSSPPASPLPEPLLHHRWLAGWRPVPVGVAAQHEPTWPGEWASGPSAQ
jgi:hypothetical protein